MAVFYFVFHSNCITAVFYWVLSLKLYYYRFVLCVVLKAQHSSFLLGVFTKIVLLQFSAMSYSKHMAGVFYWVFSLNLYYFSFLFCVSLKLHHCNYLLGAFTKSYYYSFLLCVVLKTHHSSFLLGVFTKIVLLQFSALQFTQIASLQFSIRFLY